MGSVLEKSNVSYLYGFVSRGILDMFQDWCAHQDSFEGRRFEDLRSRLPAFKEKEFLLEALARNQVWRSSGNRRKSPARGCECCLVQGKCNV